MDAIVTLTTSPRNIRRLPGGTKKNSQDLTDAEEAVYKASSLGHTSLQDHWTVAGPGPGAGAGCKAPDVTDACIACRAAHAYTARAAVRVLMRVNLRWPVPCPEARTPASQRLVWKTLLCHALR